MNKKGLLFSTDFILSAALVVLAIGLMLQFSEMNGYNAKELELRNELKRVGENAAYLLTNNPVAVCRLVDVNSPPNVLDSLPNCIPNQYIGAATPITRDLLGIRTGFKCRITFNPGGTLSVCSDALPAADQNINIFSMERDVVRYTGSGQNVPKDEFENCVNGVAGCTLQASKATIRVWVG